MLPIRTAIALLLSVRLPLTLRPLPLLAVPGLLLTGNRLPDILILLRLIGVIIVTIVLWLIFTHLIIVGVCYTVSTEQVSF